MYIVYAFVICIVVWFIFVTFCLVLWTGFTFLHEYIEVIYQKHMIIK